MIAVFELMTDQSGTTRNENAVLAERFSAVLSSYRAGNFQNALDVFTKLAEEYNDPASRIYAERCREYLQSPPPPEWDGVYISRKK